MHQRHSRSNSCTSSPPFCCDLTCVRESLLLSRSLSSIRVNNKKEGKQEKMHLSENEGIEGNTFVVTGGLGFVGSALCLELLRRGARQVRAFDLRTTSPWSVNLRQHGVHCVQGLIHLPNYSLPLCYAFQIHPLSSFLLRFLFQVQFFSLGYIEIFNIFM